LFSGRKPKEKEGLGMIVRLLKLTRNVRAHLLLKSLIGLAVTATYVAQAFLLGQCVRLAFDAPEPSLFFPLLAGVAVMVVLRFGFIRAKEIFGKHAAGEIKQEIRINLFKHFFMLGPRYMEEGRTGKLQSVFIDGVEALETFLVNYAPQLAVTVVGTAFIVTCITRINAAVGMIVFGAVLICVVCPLYWDRLMNRIGHGHWESYGDMNAQFVDAMQGVTTLKAFDAGEEKGEELERDANRLYHRTMQKLGASLAGSAIVGLSTGVATALAVGVAAFQARTGALPFAYLPVLLFLSTECFRPIRELNMYWHQSFLGLSAAEKMYEFLDTPSPVQDRGHAETVCDGLFSIAFRDISFAYDGGAAPVLEHIDLDIPAGSTVGVVGKSGAGKSTLVNLLLRFFDYESGNICLNGEELREIPIDRLRALIAVVFQETYLFYGTVEENVRIAKPGATDEEIRDCCRCANADVFIEALPLGYQTVVGERGIRLSGGEKQKIAIARAMLKSAPILILDEATSGIDAASEREIQEGLTLLTRNKTTLIIAHRLSAIMHADMIYVLENGRIAESGNVRQLAEADGAFWNLMEAQQTGEADA
jgi:ATP-binding cassette subfamily B protein